MYTPATAALPTVNVAVVLVTPAPKFAGLNDAVTFAGNPSAAIVTAPAKPPWRSSVNATVPVCPCGMLTVEDPAVSPIDGFAGTFAVKLMVVVAAVTPLPVARIVTVAEPDTAVAPSVSVRTLDVALELTVEGANAAVTPVGRPSAVSVTSPENPPVRTIVIGTTAGTEGDATVAGVPAATETAGVTPVGGSDLSEQAATSASAMVAVM